MAYNPLNPNGQASMVGSQPVVIASDQSPVSVLATIFGRPSISGQVGASVLGTVPVTQVTSPWVITGSVQGSFSPAANQSVSGTVQVDVRSSVATVIIGGSIAASFTPPANQSVSGAVSISNFPTTQNVSGSVAAFQGTNPWIVVSSVSGGIFPISGSVAATITNTNVNVGGSVVAFPVGNQSISGAVTVSNFPTTQNVSGSVVATQGTNPWIITGSVQGSFSPAANQSVSGTVNIGTGGPVSVLGTMSVLGTVPVTQTTNPWIIGSIVGTYAEDAAHATGDKGLLALAVRNDNLSSVTSADLDYSPVSVGPSGEVVSGNAPFTKWVRGTASMLTGGPVTGALTPIIPAQGASIFTYVTGLQVANMGASSVLLTLISQGTTAPLGYTIAPAGGGSNILYTNALKTTDNVAFVASISGVSSVYLSAQGFISRT